MPGDDGDDGAEDVDTFDEDAAFAVLEEDAVLHKHRRNEPYNALTTFDLDDAEDEDHHVADRPSRRQRLMRWALVAALGVVVALVIIVSVVAAVSRNQTLQEHHPTATPTATVMSAPIPSLLLLSLDGLRSEYLTRGVTPNLARLEARGVRATAMRPVFPSKTFPNHYSIATGLYSDSHGIVSNSFYDPAFGATFLYTRPSDTTDARWWGGEPIWNTVVKANKTAMCAFWPGSEAPIQGIRPTRYLAYTPMASQLNNTARMQIVLDWLTPVNPSDRPALVTAYMSSIDSAGHNYGIAAAQLTAALEAVDEAVGVLLEGLEEHGLTNLIDIIVVSDHGMVDVNMERVRYLDDYISLENVTVIEYGPTVSIFPHTGQLTTVYEQLQTASEAADSHFQAYLRQDIPVRFRYSKNLRIPPIFVLMDEGWSMTRRGVSSTLLGNHGYDNQLESMQAIFLGAGPHFRENTIVDAFNAVEIYNLIAKILQLVPAPNNGTWPSILMQQALRSLV